MAQINNREVIKRIEEEAFISPAAEQTPNQLGNTVIPVLNSNPKPRIKVFNFSRTTTAGAAMWTPTVGYDTYLVGFIFHAAYDATHNGTSATITANLDGSNTVIYNLKKFTTTALKVSDVVMFPTPIKIDGGTGLWLNQTFTAGAATYAITGYYYEIPKQ